MNQSHEGDMYRPWLRAEPDAYTVIREPYGLRIVEILRGEIFDTFTGEVNTDATDTWTESITVQVEPIGEDDESTREIAESAQERVWK